ncbi:hypothetical protein [Fructilactobacillus fructivorans]|uniref:Uncharacterized protein n=2 Tax=Fructilactobacillus fructivorans TaxID=1614 RepID=A0A0C1PNG2_9LACO|nr:hypothetical protein [Fructilactobacillus fructivorans]KID42272.1 hypothetical protein LfDm3_0201 [Fructilactobacillus fructivorans]MCT0151107.1 hypothetical protein [Fructilactobacillus fructivorans]MCT2867335.1 hypothetical protein [Fructilactobacillus fructivorans]MCT2869146.1 hypothetical protein [Fructilactobacillus fructivorans]MCT2873134.1 hypothetical protein [Fructilactobacillus fructivorans]
MGRGFIIKYSNIQGFIYKASQLLSNKLMIIFVLLAAFIVIITGYFLIRNSSHNDKVNRRLKSNHKKVGTWLICLGIIFIGLFFFIYKYVKKAAINPNEIIRTNKVNFSATGTIDNIDQSNGNYVYEIKFNGKNRNQTIYVSMFDKPVSTNVKPPIHPFSGTVIEQPVITKATVGNKVTLKSYKYAFKYTNHDKLDSNDSYFNNQLKLLNENYVNGVVTQK